MTRLRALLLDVRWCLHDDVRAAGKLQARLQPGVKHRARLLRRIDRELASRPRPARRPL